MNEITAFHLTIKVLQSIMLFIYNFITDFSIGLAQNDLNCKYNDLNCNF